MHDELFRSELNEGGEVHSRKHYSVVAHVEGLWQDVVMLCLDHFVRCCTNGDCDVKVCVAYRS